MTIFIGREKIATENELKAPDGYKGIISLWHIDGFEGGSGSRKQFLLNIARNFEKQNKGILIMVVSHSFSSLKENLKEGNFPDLISFSNGAEIEGVIEMDNIKTIESGKIGEKIYATPWCRGGYSLIENPNAKDKQKNTVIVSQNEYTQPLLALYMQGLEFENIEVMKPMDAYVKFTQNKTAYFLGTQRDIVRLTNRGMEFISSPISEFNDLYQYISLTCNDSSKSIYAKRFIDYLISDSVQKKLTEISMFSPFIDIANQNQQLLDMQNVKDFKSISAFCHSEKLKEMQSISLDAIRGNENAINKIKNILV